MGISCATAHDLTDDAWMRLVVDIALGRRSVADLVHLRGGAITTIIGHLVMVYADGELAAPMRIVRLSAIAKTLGRDSLGIDPGAIVVVRIGGDPIMEFLSFGNIKEATRDLTNAPITA